MLSTTLQCAYCENPKLFQVDFSTPDYESRDIGIAAQGHFLKRIKNDDYPAWPVPVIFRGVGSLHSKMLIGRDHFAQKWQSFNVEILGSDLTERPPMPPLPLFGLTKTTTPDRISYILWNACRITHEEFGLVINLHWWPSHGRVFSVENLDFDNTAARSALNTGLSFFSRGRRRPTEYFDSNKEFFEQLKDIVMLRYDSGLSPAKILEADIALDLFPETESSARTLRRWLQTSWRKQKWEDIVESIIKHVSEERARIKLQL